MTADLIELAHRNAGIDAAMLGDKRRCQLVALCVYSLSLVLTADLQGHCLSVSHQQVPDRWCNYLRMNAKVLAGTECHA